MLTTGDERGISAQTFITNSSRKRRLSLAASKNLSLRLSRRAANQAPAPRSRRT